MKPCKISAHSDKHLDDIFVWVIKSCPNKLKSCEVSRNGELKRCWKFQLSTLTNKKVLFLKKIWSVPCTMDSSYFSPKMATWRPNFPHPRLWFLRPLFLVFSSKCHIRSLELEFAKLLGVHASWYNYFSFVIYTIARMELNLKWKLYTMQSERMPSRIWIILWKTWFHEKKFFQNLI